MCLVSWQNGRRLKNIDPQVILSKKRSVWLWVEGPTNHVDDGCPVPCENECIEWNFSWSVVKLLLYKWFFGCAHFLMHRRHGCHLQAVLWNFPFFMEPFEQVTKIAIHPFKFPQNKSWFFFSTSAQIFSLTRHIHEFSMDLPYCLCETRYFCPIKMPALKIGQQQQSREKYFFGPFRAHLTFSKLNTEERDGGNKNWSYLY